GQRVRLARPAPADTRPPAARVPPVEVAKRFRSAPRLEALAVYKGERACTNADLIRNAAYCWSPMSADEIKDKTAIEERRYPELDLDHISLLAAQQALAKSGRRPEDITAVCF